MVRGEAGRELWSRPGKSHPPSLQAEPGKIYYACHPPRNLDEVQTQSREEKGVCISKESLVMPDTNGPWVPLGSRAAGGGGCILDKAQEENLKITITLFQELCSRIRRMNGERQYQS